MKIAALIIGIDGWERYTLPLVQSILRHEPDTEIVVIDNGSAIPYPPYPYVHYTVRTCYAKAINTAAALSPDADWYVILSNDVVCTRKYTGLFRQLDKNNIYGDLRRLGEGGIYSHIVFAMGWCVIASRDLFYDVGGWDENYVVSSWEDVDFSFTAHNRGYKLFALDLPFTHLDQRQRFALPEFVGTHERNQMYFKSKWGIA